MSESFVSFVWRRDKLYYAWNVSNRRYEYLDGRVRLHTHRSRRHYKGKFMFKWHTPYFNAQYSFIPFKPEYTIKY